MNALIRTLCADGPVVTDGAWGTQLQARGLPIGDSPDAWNLRHPDRVEQVALSYVFAGSRVILTNTFGANRIALGRHGLADQVEDINRRGAAISRGAAADVAVVFGSIGPIGRMISAGEVTEAEARSAFTEQAEALAVGGAQGFVVETMSDAEEARIAVGAAAATGLPVVGCMTFDTGRGDDVRTMMGVTPERAASVLEGVGAQVIGANCGRGAEGMLGVCRRLRAATRLPVWMKPNAGLPRLVEGQAVYDTTPGAFATACLSLVEAGADFIGGCCGTTPEHIRALGKAIKARRGTVAEAGD